ncbi:MAG: sigma factor-like helix-turn-helix DNA-binding protein [Candidatus Brennerbacteria bacterium]
MRKFKEKFHIAIDMKWKGFKYPEIAEKLGVSLDTVKSWFRSNGILRMHYKDYIEDQLIVREQEKSTKTH